jgi:hypothetical protein
VTVSIVLPLRAEWRRHREQVPASPMTRFEAGQSVTFQGTRWRLLNYVSPEKLPQGPGYTDLLLEVQPPSGNDEAWVVAELSAGSLSKAHPAGFEFHLLDRAGRTWSASRYDRAISSSGRHVATDRVGVVGVVGVVPAAVADEVSVQVGLAPPGVWAGSPPPRELGGPLLVFDR